jgi:hypothetical protein
METLQTVRMGRGAKMSWTPNKIMGLDHDNYRAAEPAQAEDVS